MKIEIKAVNAGILEAEISRLARQAHLMLGRFSNSLDRVSIHVTGETASEDPHHGELTVRVVVSRKTVAVDRDRDPGAALSRAVRRIERSLAGYLGADARPGR